MQTLTRIGPYDVFAVGDGSFALDGGAMFGVVPRPLWQCHIPPDDRHRIVLALRCLLLVDRAAGRVVLVDTGMGTRWSDKERSIFAIDQSQADLLGSLGAVGVAPGDVTDVIVTHLHFDHAGGLCRAGEDGRSVPVFEAATLHVQEANWEWALHPTPRDGGSYRADDFVPYEQAGRLRRVPGGAEVLPGVRVESGVGHTTGHQVVWVSADGGTDPDLVFGGDLVPTQAHLKPAWGMAYDLRPLECMAEKAALLDRIVERRAVLVFDHDPALAATTLRRDGRKVVLDVPVGLG